MSCHVTSYLSLSLPLPGPEHSRGQPEITCQGGYKRANGRGRYIFALSGPHLALFFFKLGCLDILPLPSCSREYIPTHTHSPSLGRLHTLHTRTSSSKKETGWNSTLENCLVSTIIWEHAAGRDAGGKLPGCRCCFVVLSKGSYRLSSRISNCGLVLQHWRLPKVRKRFFPSLLYSLPLRSRG